MTSVPMGIEINPSLLSECQLVVIVALRPSIKLLLLLSVSNF